MSPIVLRKTKAVIVQHFWRLPSIIIAEIPNGKEPNMKWTVERWQKQMLGERK